MAKGGRVDLSSLADDDFYQPSDQAGVSDSQALPGGEPTTVPTRTVVANPLNARPAGEDDEIDELAESIRSGMGVLLMGVLLPVMVCPAAVYLAEYPDEAGAVDGADWVVIMGNRRLLASARAGLAEIPVIVNREPSLMFEMMLVENVQRRPLPWMHEARTMQRAQKAQRLSARELARRMGKSHGYVVQRLALLDLIPELQQAVEAGEVRFELARKFAALKKTEQKAIVAAGKPYRMPVPGGYAVSKPRSIRVSSPTVAAQSLRERFSAEELHELVRLLTEDQGS